MTELLNRASGLMSHTTLYQNFQEVARVLFPVENAGHHAVAGKPPDRHRRAGRDPAPPAPRRARPPVARDLGPASGAVWIFADRKAVDPASRAAISAMGRLARCARWHRRARRGDRPGFI